MTPDTGRALAIIKPIADELNIEVSATDKFLVVDGVYIGIYCNSTFATVMEFVGYLTFMYGKAFRALNLDSIQQKTIKRYWLTKEQVEKIGGE